jgi:pimeloyl-ACP methyl ester carboxylesterase
VTETAQARLYAEVAGSGAPVVLVHSGLCDSRMWDSQWEVLQREHTVVRCDLRGFGRTPLWPGEYSHPADLIDLLDELRLGPAALVGASLGGGVSLQVAVARPDLVSALVLIGSGVRGHEWSEYVTSAWAAEEAALARGDLDAAVETSLRAWVDGPRRSPGDVDAAVRQRVADMYRHALEVSREGEARANETTLLDDVVDRLAEISVPTLVIAGEYDVPDVHQVAERLERELPDVRRATIAGTAHFPSLERPDEVNAIVVEFLRTVGR